MQSIPRRNRGPLLSKWLQGSRRKQLAQIISKTFQVRKTSFKKVFQFFLRCWWGKRRLAAGRQERDEDEKSPSIGWRSCLGTRVIYDMWKKRRRRNNVVLHPILPTTICENRNTEPPHCSLGHLPKDRKSRKGTRDRILFQNGRAGAERRLVNLPSSLRRNIQINFWGPRDGLSISNSLIWRLIKTDLPKRRESTN